jgi:hypothetical protein
MVWLACGDDHPELMKKVAAMFATLRWIAPAT